MKIETMPLKNLRPLKPFNGSDPALACLRENIARYGVIRPLCVNRDNVIIDGNKIWHLLVEQDADGLVHVFTLDVPGEQLWAVHAAQNNQPSALSSVTDRACDTLVHNLIQKIQIPVFFQSKKSKKGDDTAFSVID